MSRIEFEDSDWPFAAAWLMQWFNGTDSTHEGGMTRRSRRDVERLAWRGNLIGLDAVIEEARTRGWHVIENGDQVIVLCNDGDLRVHC